MTSTPEKIVFVLSTGRTGTRTLAEGLVGGDVQTHHQPPFSRLLTVASNYYLHGWLSERTLKWLVARFREPQILSVRRRYYVQVFSLDHLPAKFISQKYDNTYIIHIVRDPRTFVRSYLNWTHTRFKSFVANKFVLGWHPSGFFTGDVGGMRWCRMNEFQRVCWHWMYKNAFLERLFEGNTQYMRLRFEDLFLTGETDTLRAMLSFVGIPYRDEYASMISQGKNRSRKTYFPPWEEWGERRQQQLLDMCGEQMRRYGYI